MSCARVQSRVIYIMFSNLLIISKIILIIVQKFFAVNIMTNNRQDYYLYEENVNLIKGASRIWNVLIHLKDETVEKSENCDDMRYIYTNDCSLLIATMVNSKKKCISSIYNQLLHLT